MNYVYDWQMLGQRYEFGNNIADSITSPQRKVMIINRWMGQAVDCLPGISQKAVPQSEWCYQPDWIVSHIKWDSGNRRYWIEGKLRRDGASFFWGMDYCLQMIDGVGHIVLDWRYDLTNATYSMGRHETPEEARRRYFAKN